MVTGARRVVARGLRASEAGVAVRGRPAVSVTVRVAGSRGFDIATERVVLVLVNGAGPERNADDRAVGGVRVVVAVKPLVERREDLDGEEPQEARPQRDGAPPRASSGPHAPGHRTGERPGRIIGGRQLR